ncbi:Hypothetical_protein [Hexamita inflata]|uniref:Hypothetical_protein n=1 Tax=Hexamita inflata TaxID=28002 RepID=A0ABP1GKC4_9EUKA
MVRAPQTPRSPKNRLRNSNSSPSQAEAAASPRTPRQMTTEKAPKVLFVPTTEEKLAHDLAFEYYDTDIKACRVCQIQFKVVFTLVRPKDHQKMAHILKHHLKKEGRGVYCIKINTILQSYQPPVQPSVRLERIIWVRFLIKETILKSLPFRWVNSPYFAHIAKFNISKTQLIREIHNFSQEIQFTQFNGIQKLKQHMPH